MVVGRHHSSPPRRYLKTENKVLQMMTPKQCSVSTFFCFNNLVFKEEMIGIFPLHLPLNFKLAVLSEVVLQTEATLPFFFF